MEWIKCSEKIPQLRINGGLMIDGDEMCFVYSPTEGFECFSILDYFDEDEFYKEQNISHWMPANKPTE